MNNIQNESKKKLDRFTIELTTTQSCNFRCKYCFENDKEVPASNILSNNINKLIDNLKKIINDKWFNETYKSFQLSFWGGEPSLNLEFIEKIVKEFESNENVSFYIYTNASRINEMIPILDLCKGRKVLNDAKFMLQISYDGNPISDLTRIPKSGDKKSSEITKDSLNIIKEKNYDFSMKATLEHKNYEFLPQIWDDFYELRKKYGKMIKYVLTVDYHNIGKKDIEKLESALIKIAKKEHSFYKENKDFLSNIFDLRKAFCSAGSQSMALDIDGNIYPCHGSLYSTKKDELRYCSIFDDDFLSKIKEKISIFKTYTNSTCEECVALLCLRCNVKKFENSCKKEFLDKWNDYSNQPELCEYYKICGRIGRALYNIIKEENNYGLPS